ncbi:hypothetical protein FGO68_gene13175 [Halteria grandinella]|uniref:Protein kinase domain-containing protein n=1 Tax=Halteria grandinella TaxID=5974 RepID=A0A8J8NSI9_HALGN|nr:hypothetical protein FGO68_gene13175 [Halteria grandinella]
MHRDLKPENILISDQFKSIPKICDFGSVKKDIQENPHTQWKGSIPYFPPEKNNKGKQEYCDYSKKVDVWALGIILYKMLTKVEHIFAEAENSKYLEGSHQLEMDTKITTPCQELIRQMLEIDPKKRPSVREILNNPLIKDRINLITHQFINGQQVGARIKKQVKDIFPQEEQKQSAPQQEYFKEEQKYPARISPSSKLDYTPQPSALIKNFRFTKNGLDELLRLIRESGADALENAAIYHGLSVQRLNQFVKPDREILNLPFEGVNRSPSIDLCPGHYFGQCLNGIRDGYGLVYCKTKNDVPYLLECHWDMGTPQNGRRLIILNNLWEQYVGSFDDKYFMKGFGIESDQSGAKYEGQFMKGLYNGQGKKTLLNGQYEEGLYQDSKPVGIHMCFSREGTLIEEKSYIV